MVSWSDFERQAPAFAALGRERFDSSELVFMGTMRRSGGPRVTPIEYTLFEGELYIGGMWQSHKLLDLIADPRLVLHSTTTNKDGTDGDFKLYGRAEDVTDPDVRERYGQSLFAKMGWRPEEPYHLMRVELREAGFAVFGTGVDGFRARLDGTPGVRVRIIGGHDANASGHLVATWKAARG